MRRLLLDPLVLFLALGAGLALVYVRLRPPRPAGAANTIVVTDADVAMVAQAFERRRLRPPTVAELRGLVERQVRDERLYREAVALGLDREDPVLRRRLAMKLEYLAKDVGAAVEPTESELQAHYEANADRYAVSPRRAFHHIFFSESRRGESVRRDAEALRAMLERQDAVEPPADAGDPLLLEPIYDFVARDRVARDFGASFATAVFEAEPETWVGPVASSFGLHVVRVLAVEPGRLPELDAIRDRVREDLLTERREEFLEEYVDLLEAKYPVDMRARLPAPDAE